MSTQAIGKSDVDLTALSLRNLRSVATIAAEGSLTAAAARLGFSQATLSTHLGAAEAALGVTLFERHGRGAVPTDAGQAVLRHVATLFDTLETLRRDARGTHRPVIRVGAIDSTAGSRAMPFIRKMERRHPNLEFSLRVGTPSEVRRLVEHGDIDFAVTAKERAPSRVATFHALYDQELVLLVPENHRLAKQRRVDLRTLTDEQLIVGDDACSYRRVIEELLRTADIDVALRARFGSLAMLPHAVASGLGVTIVPRELVDPKPAKTAIVTLRNPIEVTIGILLRRDAGEDARRIADELIATFATAALRRGG